MAATFALDPQVRYRRLDPTTYRRRRLGALVVAIVVAVSAWLLVTSAVGLLGASGAGADAPPQVHVVQPGDTVWSIASRLAGDGDVRPFVDRIVERNGGAGLTVGQRLVVG